jgi:thiamine biosynthesis protein ThiS
MRVFINDKAVECEPGVTLASLLGANGVVTENVAVAVDFEVVHRDAWETTTPREGSSIIIIRASQGG